MPLSSPSLSRESFTERGSASSSIDIISIVFASLTLCYSFACVISCTAKTSLIAVNHSTSLSPTVIVWPEVTWKCYQWKDQKWKSRQRMSGFDDNSPFGDPFSVCFCRSLSLVCFVQYDSFLLWLAYLFFALNRILQLLRWQPMLETLQHQTWTTTIPSLLPTTIKDLQLSVSIFHLVLVIVLVTGI